MFGTLKTLMERLRARSGTLSHADLTANADKLLTFYTRVMTKVTDAERCSIFINDTKNDRIWLKAGTGVLEHGIEVPKESSIAGKVINSGKPMIVSDLDPKSDASKLVLEKTGFETRNILCVPIRSSTRDEITGAFELINKNNAQTFNDEDMAYATEIAEQMQDQVDSIFLNQEIFALSEQIYTTIEKLISYAIGAIGLVMFILFSVILAYITMPGWLD